MGLNDVTANSVNLALEEFDKLGREEFLRKYKFGPAKAYFIAHNDKQYDSKAIMGRAHGYARPDMGPYISSDFSGGESQVAKKLRKIGFDVTQIRVPRNPNWTRDELILALDFYLSHRNRIPDKSSTEIEKLSLEINMVARCLGLSGSDTLRNKNGVYMKLMNFRSHDPDFTSLGKKGLDRGNSDEKVVWNIFADDLVHLRKTADAIQSQILTTAGPSTPTIGVEEPEFSEAEEGKLVTRIHRTRERNRNLVRRKKESFSKKHGKVFCEACGFDFEKSYGDRGVGFIECHHTKPVHTLRSGDTTKLVDLVLLCANCHRMVHSKAKWLDLNELRSILRPPISD